MSGSNSLYDLMDKGKKAKNTINKGKSAANEVQMVVDGIKTGSGIFDNLTGGGNENHKNNWDKAVDDMPIIGDLKGLPVVGDIVSGLSDIGKSISSGLNNLFGIDDDKPPPRPKLRDFNGKIIDKYNFYKALKEAFDKYVKTGKPLQKAMGYRIFFTGTTSKDQFVNELQIGKKMFDLRMEQSKYEHAKRAFHRSNKTQETKTINGKKVFFWKLRGKTHMVINDPSKMPQNFNFSRYVKDKKQEIKNYDKNYDKLKAIGESNMARRKARFERRRRAQVVKNKKRNKNKKQKKATTKK